VGRPRDRTEVLARVSGMEAARFFGFGNDTDDGGQPHDHFTVFERQMLGDLERWHEIGRGAWLVGGLTGRYTDAEPRPGSPADVESPQGSGDWLAAGARAGVVLDRTDSTAYHRSGWTLSAFGSGFPLTNHDAEAFGGAQAVATAYLSVGGSGPTLALRAGGERVWGGFPFQYAAYLGGGRTLRGFASDRFAGDAAAYGSAELRQPLFRANLLVRGTLGAFGLADAGRVWYQGDSPGGWHTAVGGGLFFTFLDRTRAASAYYAYGEQGKLYFTLGLPF
jgi:outer membrane protein assembly factor BamA